jgi:hypothetical protein
MRNVNMPSAQSLQTEPLAFVDLAAELDDYNPMRGVIMGSLFALPAWAVILLAIRVVAS